MENQHDLSTIARELGSRGGKRTLELHGKQHFKDIRAGKKKRQPPVDNLTEPLKMPVIVDDFDS